MKNLSLTICVLALLTLYSCDKKACDCEGLIDARLSFTIDQDALENCVVVEDFTFKPDSTVTVHRLYKEEDGSTNSTSIEAAAEWRLVGTNPCVYKVINLQVGAYGFPLVEKICTSGVNVEHSFFHDLQFTSTKTIEITNQTCDGAMVNGREMKCE